MFGGAGGGGGAPSGAGGRGPGGGPPTGYGFQSYKGLSANSPGAGYSPMYKGSPAIPSYYTYGQGPQQSFFQDTAPTHMKKGGHVSKFDCGGPVGQQSPPSNAMPGVMGTLGGAMPPPMPDSSPPFIMSGGPVMAPPAQPAPPAMPPGGGLSGTMMGGGALGSMTPSASGPGASLTAQPAPQPMGGGIMPGMLSGTMGGMTPSARPARSMMPPPNFNSSNMGVNGRRGFGGRQPFGVTSAAEGGSMPAPQGALSAVSRHVKGPGDGTSDDIPARLANGEYVMDAQTVSMAGNGSNDAGAKALDKFRENIRKHKGGALAQGKMAPDAKDLNKYMGSK